MKSSINPITYGISIPAILIFIVTFILTLSPTGVGLRGGENPPPPA